MGLCNIATEFGIAMIVKAMRAASGYDVRPTGVKFAHIRAGDVQEFRRFFGCSVEFGAPSDQLEFSNETLGPAHAPHAAGAEPRREAGRVQFIGAPATETGGSARRAAPQSVASMAAE